MPRTFRFQILPRYLIPPAAALAALLAACGQPPGRSPMAAAAAPKVGVVVLQPQRLAVTTELPGRTTPFQIAEIRPQVGGVILARPFREGGDVAAGARLYQIDPAPFQASVDSAAAGLAKAEATLASAKLKAARYRELVGIQAVSQQDADDATVALQQAQADVGTARATLETARINLAYTQVTSPIAGRVGRSSVTTGALVTAGQSTVLATVQQLDPIYVDVTQSSTDLLRLRREFAAGQLKASPAAPGSASVKLLLEDGSEYALPGRLQFSEATVDSGTGAVTLRAVFPNPKGELLPGMFVRAVVEEGVNDAALLVPQAAVTRDGRGQATAYVVGADQKVQPRLLQTDRAVGDRWLVRAGLQAGERVVVDGQQGLRPGVSVEAVAWSAPRVVAAAAAAAPAAKP